ncbi:hypothetical protein [Comamonas sp. B-9]|uniref:hypothetical protein n=1 Tax=Comamonas sp. B-9 TaxID=1055192 RepID=UPI0011DDEE02|nr:hypothetical protein [Comamonas sp. B-9]
MNKHRYQVDLITELLWPNNITGIVIFLIGSFSTLLLLNFSFRELNYHRKIYHWNSNSAYIQKLAIDKNILEIQYNYVVDGADYTNSKINSKMLNEAEIDSKQALELIAQKKYKKIIEIRFNPKNPKESVYILDPNEIYYSLFIALFSIFSASVHGILLIRKFKNIIYRQKLRS